MTAPGGPDGPTSTGKGPDTGREGRDGVTQGGRGKSLRPPEPAGGAALPTPRFRAAGPVYGHLLGPPQGAHARSCDLWPRSLEPSQAQSPPAEPLRGQLTLPPGRRGCGEGLLLPPCPPAGSKEKLLPCPPARAPLTLGRPPPPPAHQEAPAGPGMKPGRRRDLGTHVAPLTGTRSAASLTGPCSGLWVRPRTGASKCPCGTEPGGQVTGDSVLPAGIAGGGGSRGSQGPGGWSWGRAGGQRRRQNPVSFLDRPADSTGLWPTPFPPGPADQPPTPLLGPWVLVIWGDVGEGAGRGAAVSPHPAGRFVSTDRAGPWLAGSSGILCTPRP